MRDNYNREIHYLRLSVTDRCNLRCSYCMPASGISKVEHTDILSFESYEKIVRVASELGIDKVRITGGEPLVRKNIVALVEKLRAIEGIKSINMTTNGVLLKDFAYPLKKAGLDRLNISLDTLNPKRYEEITRGGDINLVLSGIETAVEAGFELIKINAVLIGGENTAELSDFIKFSNSKIEVRFIELMPIGEASSWSKEKFVSAEAWLINQGFQAIEKTKSDGPARYFLNPENGSRVGLINPISNHFCSDCNRIRVTADGKLKNCLLSNNEFDLKPYLSDEILLKEVISDHIKNKPLEHCINEKSFEGIKRDMNTIGG